MRQRHVGQVPGNLRRRSCRARLVVFWISRENTACWSAKPTSLPTCRNSTASLRNGVFTRAIRTTTFSLSTRKHLSQRSRSATKPSGVEESCRPRSAFGELCKLIFVKITDEMKPRKKGEPYEFQIKTHEPARRLGRAHQALSMTHKKPKTPTSSPIRSRLTTRSCAPSFRTWSPSIFNKTDLDTKGVAFEAVHGRTFSRAMLGQYFTPREIIALRRGNATPPDETRNDNWSSTRLAAPAASSSMPLTPCAKRPMSTTSRGHDRALPALARLCTTQPLWDRDQRGNRPRRQDEHDHPRRRTHQRDRV